MSPAHASRPYHVARQPILDRRQDLVAYELLFRSEDGCSVPILDPRSATASVILGAFCDLGLGEVLGKCEGYVNVDLGTLQGDVLALLPRERVVLELLETIVVDRAVIDRVRELAGLGYRFALDDVIALEPVRELLPFASIVKIDVLAAGAAEVESLVDELRRRPDCPKLLAEKVETPEMRRRCLELGFDLFQGYHFAKPELVSGRRLEPSTLALLRLLALTQQDCENAELEAELRHHPDLVFRLLRVVNSVAAAPAESVGSLRQALIVLGRRQLRRWLLLLAFHAPNAGEARPGAEALKQLAANRAALLERLAALVRPHDRDFADRAYLAGLLSLFDALLGMPLYQILHELAPAEEIREALLDHRGAIAALLELVEKIERGDVEAAEPLLGKLGQFGSDALVEAEVGALRATNALAE